MVIKQQSPISGQFSVKKVSENKRVINSRTGEVQNYRDLLLTRNDRYGSHQLSARCPSIGCYGVQPGDVVDVAFYFRTVPSGKKYINQIFISNLDKVEEKKYNDCKPF